jgi:hypothetical protein
MEYRRHTRCWNPREIVVEVGAMVYTSSTVRLLVFPRDDDALQSALEGIESTVGGWEHVTPDDLQRRLRRQYPAAVVRRQDPLGTLDGYVSAWYVYRDGSPTRARQVRAGLSLDPTVRRQRTS